MDAAELLALELDRAVQFLQAKGFDYQIRYTNAPFAAEKGKKRVVQVKLIDAGTVLLTAAFESCLNSCPDRAASEE